MAGVDDMNNRREQIQKLFRRREIRPLLPSEEYKLTKLVRPELEALWKVLDTSKQFVVEYLRGEAISRLEDMTTEELIERLVK